MPEFPFAASAPDTEGKVIEVLGPSFAAKLEGSESARYELNRKVSPLESERCTGTTGRLGSLTEGLSFAMAGSSQFLIVPSYIPARTVPFSLRWVFCIPGRL